MSSKSEEPAVPLSADVFSSACDSRAVLQHLTGRWGALTVAALKLGDGPMRFGEIRRRVQGISDRMLSQTLGQLERDGMVERTVHSNIPPNVDYALTPLGLKIAEPMLALIGLLEAELPQVLAAQQTFDEASPTE
ncbi:winged helix-turn-helix transcriptional regulator [Gulosibacter chungangensis]|uniref:Helix-turn-helix transcriptional regulator n=1 Tax=Gulosibacter chungangensis TaxID=979746 RepID=A0A7J5BBM3_9MICO|nr:helix-turn-helix domain-containing protein [Gulosibacter chungangensis]KAB1643150.1 helix-turn-helix transcriptional regulator [Gulosibacter chungangensis]